MMNEDWRPKFNIHLRSADDDIIMISIAHNNKYVNIMNNFVYCCQTLRQLGNKLVQLVS